jgi:arsenite-transporting ATPase
MRQILYTGKGGVGKTSIAAASAVRCAELGRRTVVLSTDAAHSLSDAMGVPLGPTPKLVRDNLEAVEIDVTHELREHWGGIQEFVVRFLRATGMGELAAEEFAILPGMEELFSLLRLQDLAASGRYDVAIIDCAPTGATVQMLGLPDAFRWYFEKLYPVERQLMKAVKPVAEKILEVPMPEDQVYAAVERLARRVAGMRESLSDARATSIRLVANPEKMVLRETQRAFSFLSLFGYPVDAVILNRVLPEAAGDGYLAEWREIQRGYLEEAAQVFPGVALRRARLFEREMVGLEALSEFARELYGDLDPGASFAEGSPLRFGEVDGHYELTVRLPGIDRGDLDLWVRGDELVIQVRNVRRHLLLPRRLEGLEIRKARFQGDVFSVVFERPRQRSGGAA